MAGGAIVTIVQRALARVDKTTLSQLFSRLTDKGIPGATSVQGVIKSVRENPEIAVVVASVATPPLVDALVAAGADDEPSLATALDRSRRATAALAGDMSFGDRVQLLRDVKAVANRLGFYQFNSPSDFQRLQTAVKALLVFGPQDLADLRRIT